MKKTKVFLIMAGIITASFFSCKNAVEVVNLSENSNYSTSRAVEVESESGEVFIPYTPSEWTTYVATSNHSFIGADMIGCEIKVTALLSVNGNYFSLIENPSSRSRVTFGLDIEDEKLKQELRKLNHERVTVSGILTEVSSPWSKRMKALKIEEDGEIENPLQIGGIFGHININLRDNPIFNPNLLKNKE